MAVVSNNLSARLRLTDADNKTAATFYGVDPDVTADELDMFSRAVSALRVNPIGGQYLIVETELMETEA